MFVKGQHSSMIWQMVEDVAPALSPCWPWRRRPPWRPRSASAERPPSRVASPSPDPQHLGVCPDSPVRKVCFYSFLKPSSGASYSSWATARELQLLSCSSLSYSSLSYSSLSYSSLSYSSLSYSSLSYSSWAAPPELHLLSYTSWATPPELQLLS